MVVVDFEMPVWQHLDGVLRPKFLGGFNPGPGQIAIARRAQRRSRHPPASSTGTGLRTA